MVIGQASAPVTITVTNHGAAAVTLNPVTAPAEFAATSGCDGATLNQNDSCTFDVTFHPVAPGAKSAILTVSSASASADISLSGMGLNTLPAPKPTAPANGALIYGHTVRLSWRAVKGATGYHVEVGTDAGFVNPLTQFGDPTRTTFTTQALAYGLYFWHVASKDTSGQGGYSAPFSFEVTLNKLPRRGVTLITGRVSFAWQAVRGATYDLQVNSAQDFTGTMFVDTTTGTPLKRPGYVMPRTAPLPGGLKTYYWRVRDSITGQWTLPWSFIVK